VGVKTNQTEFSAFWVLFRSGLRGAGGATSQLFFYLFG
jgi:hypothetical protein